MREAADINEASRAIFRALRGFQRSRKSTDLARLRRRAEKESNIAIDPRFVRDIFKAFHKQRIGTFISGTGYRPIDRFKWSVPLAIVAAETLEKAVADAPKKSAPQRPALPFIWAGEQRFLPVSDKVTADEVANLKAILDLVERTKRRP